MKFSNRLDLARVLSQLQTRRPSRGLINISGFAGIIAASSVFHKARHLLRSAFSRSLHRFPQCIQKAPTARSRYLP